MWKPIAALVIAVLAAVQLAPEAWARGGGSHSGGSRSHSSGGSVYVHGYTRRDGTYVQPHYRSAADGNFANNWSTAGNVNPYTGAVGTKTTPPASYGQDVWVDGYVRSDGTYVQGHWRSAPDGDASNNWSTAGNVNPYTGAVGTRRWPAGYEAGALYTTTENQAALDLPLSRMLNERSERPSYFKLGRSGRRYYFWGDQSGGYWSSPMGDVWPQIGGTVEDEPWSLHRRLIARLETTSWTAAATVAIEDGRFGTALRLIEAHFASMTPQELASLREDIEAAWDVRVQEARFQWSSGQQRLACEEADALAEEYRETSLGLRTADWAATMHSAAQSASAGSIQSR